MYRREFFRKLALLFTTLPLGLYAKKHAKNRWVELTTLRVAGLQYGELAEHAFFEDEEFTVVREPDNPYDRHAVALYKENQRVGYIPRTDSRVFASLLDSGHRLRIRVSRWDPKSKPWDRLWVAIWLKDDRTI